MSQVSVAELAKAITDIRNLRAEPVERNELGYAGVNVWSNRGDRYPWTTVYEPLGVTTPPDPRMNLWVWGPNFEHDAPADTLLVTLANLVADTIPLPADRND